MRLHHCGRGTDGNLSACKFPTNAGFQPPTLDADVWNPPLVGNLTQAGTMKEVPCVSVWPVVELVVAGSGSDSSEELVVGVEPAALDCRVAPSCPPEPVVNDCRRMRATARAHGPAPSTTAEVCERRPRRIPRASRQSAIEHRTMAVGPLRRLQRLAGVRLHHLQIFRPMWAFDLRRSTLTSGTRHWSEI